MKIPHCLKGILRKGFLQWNRDIGVEEVNVPIFKILCAP